MGTKGRVTMHFGDGNTIDAWNQLNLRESFTDPLSSLTFEAAPPRRFFADYRKRLAKGELVTVFINDANQGSFLIQTVDRTVSKAGGCMIKVNCNTVLVTPYQGHVNPDLALRYTKGDVTIEEAILAALKPYGFVEIEVDEAANSAGKAGVKITSRKVGKRKLSDFKLNTAVAQENEAAYQFCTRIVTRLGAVLRVDARGKLLVCVPDYEQAPLYTVAQVFGKTFPREVDAFIGDVHIHDSNDGQFSQCTIRGQNQLDTTSTQRPDATILDSDIHPNRPCYSSFAANFKPKIIRDKNSRDVARARSVATLELGARAVDAFWVEGEVDGFVAGSGAIWTIDTMGTVIVEAEELNEDMWLSERTMRQDVSGGQRTQLKWLPPNALQLGELPTS